jgi:hypothetical protein
MLVIDLRTAALSLEEWHKKTLSRPGMADEIVAQYVAFCLIDGETSPYHQ